MLKSICAAIIILLLGAIPGFAGDDIRITEAEAKEAAIVKPVPEYPAVARQLKITGKVELELRIDENGQVTNVKILSGNAVLTRVSAKTANEWKFKPFHKDGKAVPAVTVLTFEFH